MDKTSIERRIKFNFTFNLNADVGFLKYRCKNYYFVYEQSISNVNE